MVPKYQEAIALGRRWRDTVVPLAASAASANIHGTEKCQRTSSFPGYAWEGPRR